MCRDGVRPVASSPGWIARPRPRRWFTRSSAATCAPEVSPWLQEHGTRNLWGEWLNWCELARPAALQSRCARGSQPLLWQRRKPLAAGPWLVVTQQRSQCLQLAGDAVPASGGTASLPPRQLRARSGGLALNSCSPGGGSPAAAVGAELSAPCCFLCSEVLSVQERLGHLRPLPGRGAGDPGTSAGVGRALLLEGLRDSPPVP